MVVAAPFMALIGASTASRALLLQLVTFSVRLTVAVAPGAIVPSSEDAGGR